MASSYAIVMIDAIPFLVNGPTTTSDLWATIGVSVSSIIAGSALVISILAYKKRDKKTRFDALVEVFALLNGEDERKARKELYEAYKHFSQKHRLQACKTDILRDMEITHKFPTLIRSVKRIRADFDQIGTFNENGLIPEKPFMDSCWDPTIRCWICLEDRIKHERTLRNNIGYMKYFETLYKKAEEYRILNNYPQITFY